MKVFFKAQFFFFALLLISSCNRNAKKPQTEQPTTAQAIESIPFPIQRGVNISHWLSQNDRKGPERAGFFTERDVEFIASLGYDHIRLPVDEEHLWDEAGNKLPEGFQLMRNAITWCHIYKLRIIIDLHIIRSHYFNSKSNTLWTDGAEHEHFIRMWLQISDELKQYSTGMVAYELLNEAVAEDADDWNRLVADVIKALRAKEPNRKIIVGSNRWQSPDTFDQLVLPPGDKNIILSFHFYDPHIFTHYRARWENTGRYTGPVHYPGGAIEPADLKGWDTEMVNELKQYTRVYNRDTLLAMIQKPIRYAQQKGLPLYCGEFGCLPNAPRSERLQWYADVRYNFETNHIAWANWDYKGGFAIFDFTTGQPDRELINVLLGPLKE